MSDDRITGGPGGGCATEALAVVVFLWLAFHVTEVLAFMDAWLAARP